MLKRPYIPLGCTQQGRRTPTKLTARHLQLQIAGKRERRPLPDLLLATGAMEGPYRRTRAVKAGPVRRFFRSVWDLFLPCID